MNNNGLRLSEEQAWILRRVIEAAVQLLTNEEDIKSMSVCFRSGRRGTVYLSLKKFDMTAMCTNAFFLTLPLRTRRQATRFTGSL